MGDPFPPLFGLVEKDPGVIYTTWGLRLDRECAKILADSYDALFPGGKPLSATTRRYAKDPASWPGFLSVEETLWRKIELDVYRKHLGWI